MKHHTEHPNDFSAARPNCQQASNGDPLVASNLEEFGIELAWHPPNRTEILSRVD